MECAEIVKSIIEVLKLRNLDYHHLLYYANIGKDDKKTFDLVIKELEERGIIFLNHYNEYHYLDKSDNYVCGTIKLNKKKQVYVTTGRKTYIIPNEYLNGSLENDKVIIQKLDKSFNGHSLGKVEKIIDRPNGNIICDYNNDSFKSYNWPVDMNIRLPKKEKRILTNGSRVLLNLSLEKKRNKYNGQIVSIVGHKNDPTLDIKTIVTKYGVIINFSKDSLNQLNDISYQVTEEEIKNRLDNGGLDLRDKNIFTIDGENTKDMDDAVSIEKLDNGNYLLGVHIADVSYYVKEDTPLDLEARNRSTSIYPYNSSINMLPHKLANGICSLNPNVDRLALSCIMEINSNGDIVKCSLEDTIINSKLKMSYEKVNDIFENNQTYEEYTPYLNDLKLMLELSDILEKKKIERGYINFGDNEIMFEDEDGKAKSIQKYIRGKSQKLIENFMLTANECVSGFYYWINFPGIYRNHPSPNRDSVQEIIDLLNLKISVPKTLENPHTIQNIINIIQKYDKEHIYTNLLLKSMKRAYYSPNNIGHYGLALENYTHFTSPIRRYPDLQTHRIVRQIRDDIMNIDTEQLYDKLKDICINASIKERTADKIEKAVNCYKVAEYMEKHLNEYFIANISYIGKKGVCIKTQEGIKGKLNFEMLRHMGYNYDSDKKRVINNESNDKLYIGDEIKVLSKSADKELGKIEFQFIEKIKDYKIKQLKK